MRVPAENVRGQIQAILEFYETNCSRINEGTNEGWALAGECVTRALACIERIAGPDSVYFRQVGDTTRAATVTTRALLICSVLRGLKADVEAGYLISLR